MRKPPSPLTAAEFAEVQSARERVGVTALRLEAYEMAADTIHRALAQAPIQRSTRVLLVDAARRINAGTPLHTAAPSRAA